MKKIALLFTLFSLLACGVGYSVEPSKKEMKRIEKEAKAQAKKLTQQGWMVSPGAMTIERQLEKAYVMESERGEDGDELYVMGNGQSVAKSYDAAKKQAIEMAKQDIAAKLQSEITNLVEISVANDQLDSEDAESVTRVVSESRTFSNVNLGRLITVTEVYRDIKGTKSKEVLVRVACNYNTAMNAAKSALRKSLEDRGDKLREKLDGIMDK